MNPTAIARALALLLSVLLSLLLPAGEAEGAEPASPTIYRIGVVGGGGSANKKVRETLGALTGVAKVAYDCKTAVVTMKEGGTMTEAAAKGALEKKGFKMSRFEPGAPPTVAVYLFRARDLGPGGREALARRLRETFPEARSVEVDSGGYAILEMNPGKETTKAQIAGALEEAGSAFAGLGREDWPVSSVSYVGRVEGADSPAGLEEVREALRRLEKVLAAQVFAEGGSCRIRLKQPCARIEAAVKEVLGAKGYAVSGFGRAST